MAKYTGPSCRLCRREGTKLFLKGVRCNTEKCSFERRKFAPGDHGRGFRRKVSDYGVHLREKQKARRIYGILEKQFRKYFKMSEKKAGITGENLLQLLESRLDNLVYRVGFAPSRSSARQLVNHGHIRVDGKKVDIPSYLVKLNQEISIAESSRNLPIVKEAMEAATDVEKYEWLSIDQENYKGTLISIPLREQIPVDIDERLIVEYYSK
ncbi:MAG: 30S ribosomal protein S4 [Candidatus Cloacimonas sp.]|jgi:small subunit ribosomal protein S4|nr:30S ribosomal protein S4 [Candidatus Cloacimonadota bacterium]